MRRRRADCVHLGDELRWSESWLPVFRAEKAQLWIVEEAASASSKITGLRRSPDHAAAGRLVTFGSVM